MSDKFTLTRLTVPVTAYEFKQFKMKCEAEVNELKNRLDNVEEVL